MDDLIDIAVPLEQEGATSVVRSWMVRVGDSVIEGDAVVELETDKVAFEVVAPCTGIVSEIFLKTDCVADPCGVLGKIKKPNCKGAAGPVDCDTRHSPSVRRILAEANLTGNEIVGTGREGRLTKADALAYVSSLAAQEQEPALKESAVLQVSDSNCGRFIPHTPMRRAIAQNMSQSVAAAPHVTAVFEVDCSAIMSHRRVHKEKFAAEKIHLTLLTYFIAATVEAMKAVPSVNSRWYQDKIELLPDFNIGVGTSLGDEGLVVPVLRKAQTLSMQGIASVLQDLVGRAKADDLSIEDTRGGTFTISNHGVSGSLVAAPIIIKQPQSASLGLGKIEKRVCVVDINGTDSIQILPKAFVSLSVDHRVLDGHQTNAWLTAFSGYIENHPRS